MSNYFKKKPNEEITNEPKKFTQESLDEIMEEVAKRAEEADTDKEMKEVEEPTPQEMGEVEKMLSRLAERKSYTSLESAAHAKYIYNILQNYFSSFIVLGFDLTGTPTQLSATVNKKDKYALATLLDISTDRMIADINKEETDQTNHKILEIMMKVFKDFYDLEKELFGEEAVEGQMTSADNVTKETTPIKPLSKKKKKKKDEDKKIRVN